MRDWGWGWGSVALCSLAILGNASAGAWAQARPVPSGAIPAGIASRIAQGLPACLPPQSSETLVMVLNQTPNTLEQLRSVVPRNASLTVCDYLGLNVTRIGGFATPALARDWADYLNRAFGYRAFTTVATAPNPTPQPGPISYAVLVNHYNRPDLLDQVQQVTGRRVTVVTYDQRPHLLVTSTNDWAIAAGLLRDLSDRGFVTLIVDGRQIAGLRPVGG
ncbi:hypothetical protein HNI00_07865 [Thermoleptolyngbya oregonensis NK1-22]|uniref:Uncharacterized protein n=1 Tax=Thermoleptolyngbya oregonensis NK1-22 TaxID=2547457 RepID=A0AA96Y5M6_9CYAN|nr:hypothetical protein [Thermoleptolyngbya oregonensis]WOB43084.1 hypothetical protein HNI00_07865 [Thermoleptolyngbya oregonensis NK1-22]